MLCFKCVAPSVLIWRQYFQYPFYFLFVAISHHDPLTPNPGGHIAELMLDFIDWLTDQDFGRRCMVSVRDILSWVNFLNLVCERDADGFMTMGDEGEEEAEWDLRLDTVTAFIHAACLVYVDAIGSGQIPGH